MFCRAGWCHHNVPLLDLQICDWPGDWVEDMCKYCWILNSLHYFAVTSHQFIPHHKSPSSNATCQHHHQHVHPHPDELQTPSDASHAPTGPPTKPTETTPPPEGGKHVVCYYRFVSNISSSTSSFPKFSPNNTQEQMTNI